MQRGLSRVARFAAGRAGEASMALPGFTALVRGEAAGRRAAAAPIAAMLGHRLHTTRGSGDGRVEHNVRQALAHPWEVPEWVSGHVGGRSAASSEREEAMLDFEMQDFRQDYIGAPATPSPRICRAPGSQKSRTCSSMLARASVSPLQCPAFLAEAPAAACGAVCHTQPCQPVGPEFSLGRTREQGSETSSRDSGARAVQYRSSHSTSRRATA